MKPFPWTVPELPLSAAEKRSHRKFRENQNLPPKLDHETLPDCEPQNWRERWALYRLRKERSPWSASLIVAYVAFFTWMWHDSEAFRRFLPFLWILAALVVDQAIRDSATKSILQRLGRKPEKNTEE